MASTTALAAAAPGLRRIYAHVRPHLRTERRLLALGSGALFLEVAMRLLEPWPLKYVLDAVVVAAGADLGTAPPGDLRTVLLVAALALVGVVTVRALAAFAMTLCFALAGNRVLTRIRAQLFSHLHALGPRFHEGARTGDMVTRVTGDVGRLQEVAVTAALPLLGNVVTLLGMLVVIAVLDWQLALLVLIIFPAFLGGSARVSRKIRTVARTQRKAEGALASVATESLGSIGVVQAYSMQSRMEERFATGNARSLKDGVQGKRLSAGLERSTDLLVGLATALVLYVGALRVVAGALTPGELVVFLTYLKTAFKPMRDLAKYTARIAKAAASGERIVDVLEEEPEIADRSWARPAPALRGDVRFRDVHVSYTEGSPVLRGVDLWVRPGERVAVVGGSGAGKSTLLSLLTRLRDPDEGQVLLDGHDLRDLQVATVRAQVAIVLQESVLFTGTLRDNILAGRPDAREDEVVAAARLAGAHGFISELPLGYDTPVGERGETLSGGQRQRVAIARAALRRAPVVVLDEALTGLDEDTAKEVSDALDELTRGCTTFVITHDLAAARRADRVLWLEAGTLREEVAGRAVAR